MVDNPNYENTDKNCRPNNKTGLSFLKFSNIDMTWAQNNLVNANLDLYKIYLQ